MICSPEQKVLKLEEDWRSEHDGPGLNDEIAKIRREFDAAKKSFLKIPEALKEMPKMNPKGCDHYLSFKLHCSYSNISFVHIWALRAYKMLIRC